MIVDIKTKRVPHSVVIAESLLTQIKTNEPQVNLINKVEARLPQMESLGLIL